jgi:hypothetical protein
MKLFFVQCMGVTIDYIEAKTLSQAQKSAAKKFKNAEQLTIAEAE